MDIEFHYWITGMIAQAAGFPDDQARIIAYSSQYVDDNTLYLHVRDRSSGEVFHNEISQTLDIGKPQEELMAIWPAFHFVPGDPNSAECQRKDGLRHVMNTTPGSPNVCDLLGAAFEASDCRLYRIGIATHAFADSWAHQNFVGGASEFNNIPGVPLLNIGHLDAGTDPDTLNTRWSDTRLVDEQVENNWRFLDAARRLFQQYSNYLGNTGDSWIGLAGRLQRLMAQSRDQRRQFCDTELAWLGGYDPHRWLQEAAQDDPEPFAATLGKFMWKNGQPKEKTDWYQFQMAVKAHKDLAVGKLRQLYADTRVGALSVL
jgi:hypothetical protein